MVDLADIFSTIGTILSFIMSFSPLPPIIKVFKKEEKIDIIPEGFLLFLILTRIVWGSVWIITGRKIALLNSVLGVFVCDVFVILYFFLYFNRTYLKTFFASIFLIFIEYGICYIGVFWGDYLTLSYIAMVFNVIMFISPGQKILRVIKEKNYKLIPIYSTVINVLVSSTWLGFGICINLISQIIPNALGVFFSILNTSLWIYFYINRDKEKEKSEKEDEVELVEK
jgi:solute carrier family 50 protein (sugar transporter)